MKALLPCDTLTVVHEEPVLKTAVLSMTGLGFVLQIEIVGQGSMRDVAILGQVLRDFFQMGDGKRLYLLLDISKAEMFTLQQLQAFVADVQTLKPQIEAHLVCSAVRTSSALLENPFIKHFRSKFYQPLRPNLVMHPDKATAENIMRFFKAPEDVIREMGSA